MGRSKRKNQKRRKRKNQAQNFTIEFWYKLNLAVEYLINVLSIILHNEINDPSYTGLPRDGQKLHQLMVAFKQQAPTRFIHANQWDLLCPPNGKTSNSNTWDVTLICAVIRNWPKSIPPLNNYLQLPRQLLDLADEIREFRNKIKHKCLKDFQDQQEFLQSWNELKNILQRCGLSNLNEFDSLGSENILPNKVVQFLKDNLTHLEESFDTKLKSQNDSTDTKLLTIQQQFVNLKNDLQKKNANEISGEIQRELAKFSNSYDLVKCELEERLDKMENSICNAQNQLDDVKDEIENVKDEIGNVKDKVDVVEGIMVELKTAYDSAQKSKEISLSDFQMRVKSCRDIVNEKYLQTSIRKPLLGRRGNIVFQVKDFQTLFVDLTIIKDQYVDRKADISDRKHHLKYLDVQKEFISYKDVASMKEQCIFVQGVAGVGKSMFVQKLVSEWHEGRLFKGENGGTRIDLLLPILCRELNMLNFKSNAGVDDILAKLFPKIPNLDALQKNDFNVMIIMDGIDELRDITSITKECVHSPVVNFVEQLLNPRFMNTIRCMIVGRPHVIIPVKEFYKQTFYRPAKTVQICGFNKENVGSYVYKAFEKSKDADNVLDKIKSSQVIEDLSTIPLYLEVLVNIFKDNPFGKPPLTATELLLYNVLIFLRNQKPGKRLSLGQFIEKYSEQLINYIREISKFSYETLITNEIIFEAGESDILEELVKTGLLLKSYKGESNIITYQFLHLTYQELFASFHILFNDNVIDFENPILRESMVIAAGLQGISNGNYGESKNYILISLLQLPAIKENFLRHIIEGIRNNWTSSDTLRLNPNDLIVEAVFENQTRGSLFGGLTLVDVTFDMIYENQNQKRTHMFFLIRLIIKENPNIRFHKAVLFFPADLKNMDSILLLDFMSRCTGLRFEFTGKEIHDDDIEKIKQLMELLYNQNVLEELRMQGCSNHNYLMHIFHCFAKIPDSSILPIRSTEMHIQSLSQEIVVSKTLREIALWRCKLTDEIFRTLLHVLVTVETVDVTQNELTQLSLYRLYQRLTPLSSLKVLYFGDNTFVDEHFDEIEQLNMTLNKQISTNVSLLEISLGDCSLTDEIFRTLLDLFVHVESVDVTQNELTQLSLYRLYQRLTPSSSLKELYFGGNQFVDGYFDEIEQFNMKPNEQIPTNISLRKIDIDLCSLTDEIFRSLLDVFVHVESVNVSNNKLTQLSLYRLFQRLTPSSLLKELNFECNNCVFGFLDCEIDPSKINYDVTINKLVLTRPFLCIPYSSQILSIAVRITKKIVIGEGDESELQDAIRHLATSDMRWKLESIVISSEFSDLLFSHFI